MVFAKVGEAVTVSIPVGVVGTEWVKAPVVSTREGITHPSAVLNLPPVRHAVPIRIRVRGVGGGVNVGQGEVGGVGCFAFGAVAHVRHLHRVIAPKCALFVEEPVVFRTVANAIAVGVPKTWVSGVVAFRREFDVAVFVEVGPQPLEVHVAGLIQVQAVSIVVEQRIPRVGGVQSVDHLPTVRHPISVRIVGARVHELQVGVASWRRCTKDRDVALAHRRRNGHDFTGQACLVLKAVDGSVVTCERPKAPFRANQHFIAGRIDGTDVVRLLGEFSIHAGMDVQPAVFNEIIVQIQFVEARRRSKP